MSSRGEKLVALTRAQAIESSEEEFEEDSDPSVKDKYYVPSSDEDEKDLEIVGTEDFEELENMKMLRITNRPRRQIMKMIGTKFNSRT
ncbi:hypothetical protein JTB14_028800 [Gonioctena quinquepunctata]|nr:hypothetical protein JTB14_028800 [Gonioctena quinquepunctata]